MFRYFIVKSCPLLDCITESALLVCSLDCSLFFHPLLHPLNLMAGLTDFLALTSLPGFVTNNCVFFPSDVINSAFGSYH